jgi:STIP1 family protein 1
MLTAKYKADVAEATQGMRDEELADELDYLKRTYEDKIRNLESVFAKADKELEAKEVPDYLLDPISFNLYMDPVIVKSGQSFERSWILQHLKTSKTDPFSRERLTEKDLIPNLQLKAAAEVSCGMCPCANAF